MTDDGAAVRFRDVILGYDGRAAIRGLTGAIRPGALLALAGPNGAGKSTVLKAIAGTLRPIAGTIERRGLGRHDIAVLPQHSEIDRAFPLSVFEMVGAGLWPSVGALRGFGRDGARRIAAAIAAVGLSGMEDRPVGTLSGGQFQRALFCRMSLQEACLVLLDEPFASIDRDTTADLLRLMLAWHRQGRTILAALHDIEQIRAVFPETLLLAGEPVAWGPTAAVLTEANLAEAQHRAHGAGNTGMPARAVLAAPA